jgi:hypothetical protein
MSKKPPLPEDAVSPYPIAEPPHEAGESEALAAVRELKAATKRWSPTRKQLGIGAATVGIGSAAIVAALLYWRGNRK